MLVPAAISSLTTGAGHVIADTAANQAQRARIVDATSGSAIPSRTSIWSNSLANASNTTARTEPVADGQPGNLNRRSGVDGEDATGLVAANPKVGCARPNDAEIVAKYQRTAGKDDHAVGRKNDVGPRDGAGNNLAQRTRAPIGQRGDLVRDWLRERKLRQQQAEVQEEE